MLTDKRNLLINDILPKVLTDIVNDYLITKGDKVAQLILNQKEPIIKIPWTYYKPRQTFALNWFDSKKCGDPQLFDYTLTMISDGNQKRWQRRRSHIFTMQSLLAKSKEDQEKYPIMMVFKYAHGNKMQRLWEPAYDCIVEFISNLANH